MRRDPRGSRTFLIVGAISFAVATAVADAARIPLPPGIEETSGEAELALGNQPVDVSVFTTDMPWEAVHEFYIRALPKEGWTVEPLPWIGEFQKRWAGFQDAVRANPEMAGDPKVQEAQRAVEDNQMERRMKLLIHARHPRSKERIVLNLNPTTRGGTRVFINEFEEGDWPGEQTAAATGGAGLPGPSDALKLNTCCTGGSVPQHLQRLPTSIPRYPNARVMSTAAMPPQLGAGQTISETLATKDAPAQVIAYYQQQMPYNGWKPIEVPESSMNQGLQHLGPMANSMDLQMVVFRKGEGLCGISVGRSGQGLPGLPVEADTAPKETMITLNYMELPAFGREWRKAPAVERLKQSLEAGR